MQIEDAIAIIPELNKDSVFERLGGLTNKNYLVQENDQKFVLRLPGEGSEELVDRKVEGHNARIVSNLGINAEILFYDIETGLQLCRFLDGAETLSGESIKNGPEERILRIAQSLKEVHVSGQEFKGRFNLGTEIKSYRTLIAGKNVELPAGFADEFGFVEDIIKRLDQLDISLGPCHCDPVAENFLDDGGKVFIIDWEYSGQNDPLWDLGALACECEFSEEQDIAFLTSYYGRKPLDEEHFRYLAYRVLSDFLWAMWGLNQSVSVESDYDYEEYALMRFERYLLMKKVIA